MTIIVYCVTNLVNGKKYVGQTSTTIQRRWYKHAYIAIVKNANTRFYEAIRKHGKEAFDGGLPLQECASYEAADVAESAWILALGTIDPEKGYNMMTGASTMRGNKLSPDACEKIRQSKLGKPLTIRTKKTDEKHRPLVEAFKAGRSRKQIAEEFCLSQPYVVKALLRWKRLHEPELEVGQKHQYASSGRSLQRNALKRNQRMIDMVTKEGKSRKQVANELGVTYALVKNVILLYRRRAEADEQGTIPTGCGGVFTRSLAHESDGEAKQCPS